jgi:uncharacterized repeat protein (TIGR01451 family)
MYGSVPAARRMRAPWLLVLFISLFAALGALAFAAARADAVPLAGSPNPLPGSSFEGGDADQAASAPLRTDWQNVSPVNHSPDPNLDDNIFAGGNEGKESDPGNWNFATQNGGSTPGKNNILDAYSFNDPVSTNVFLYLAFTRGDDTGTTYMAFELNQRSNLWNNGKADIPCRTTGDIIVSYQVSGNSPDVILQKWTTTTADATTGCARTGSLSDFTAFTDNVDVQGAVNAAPITNYLPSSFTWPGNQIPAKLFGEAALNLTTLLDDALGTPCFSFGSIWMHTRASTSDSANLDDYIGPRPLLVRNCSASGTKFNDLDQDGVKDAGEPGLAGFRIWADYDNDGVRDAGEPFADTDASGNYTITNIQDPSGTYSLREQLAPGGGSTGGWICSAPQTTGTGGDFPCAYSGINGATTPNVTGRDFGNYKPGAVVIDKTADAASVSAGDQIGFTIKVTNTGQGNANGVTVSDTLPTAAGLSWTESPDDAACEIAAGKLTCDFGTIAPGASKSVHVVSPTTAATCGIVDNTATVTSSGAGSGSDSDSVDVNCAAIDVEKTADAESVSAGEQVGFTVTLKNTGEGQAKGVQFTDVLPAGLAWTISPASAGWSIANGNLVYAPTTLNAGASTTVHVVATTDATDCGQLDNTATVTTTNDGSDQDSASIDVNCAAIDVEKTADADAVSAGEQIGFTVTLSNTGEGQAKGVTFTDVLPSGLEWSISPASAGWSIQGQNLVFAPTTLNAGASSSVHVVATTDKGDCGEVSNTASVTTSNDGSDSDSDSVDVRCAAIDVDKTADAASVSAGEQIGFTVTLQNTGAGEAKGVQFTDVLPAGLSWSISPASAGWSIANGNLVFAPTTMAPGAVTTVHVVATTDKEDCGQVDNTASVTTTNDGSDSDSASVDVNCAEIDVDKVADDDSVSAGDQIGFTVTLKNTGAGEAKGVQFTDVLPAGLSWAISPASAGWSIQGQNLVFAPSTLATGASTSVHVVATTDAGDCGDVENTASVTTTNDGSDSDSASVDVNCGAIDVDKTADAASVSAGEQIGFTVTLKNTGEGEARGLQFTDALPAGLTWTVSPASAGWSIANGNLVYAPTALAAGATTTVHVVATTDKEDCGQVDNTASVTTSNAGSDADDASVDVNCAAIDVAKVADDDSVSAGEQIGFTVTLRNTGEGEAKGITFTDALPAGLTWAISPASAGWSIADGMLVFAPATMAAGASTSVHVTATTDKEDCGTVTNTASVTTSNDGSDGDTATVEVLCAAIDVDKVADAESVTAGDQIGFTVTLKNTGEGQATGIQFTDVLPAGFAWSISPDSAGWSIADGKLVLAPTTMAAGALTTVHVIAPTDKEDCGTVTNTATVTTANDGSDTDDAKVDVLCGMVDLEKLADADSVTAGDDIGFTLKVTNKGLGQARDVTITDTLPVEPGVAWSVDQQDEGTTCSITAGVLTCDLGAIDAGASESVHISSPTTAASCGTVDNTASVTTSNDGSDTADDSLEVLCGDIELTKTADADSVNAGDAIGFTLNAENVGVAQARDVKVTDALPAKPGLSWSVSPAVQGCAIAAGTLTCDLGTIAAGASKSVHVTSPTTAGSCGRVDNTGSVTTSNADSDEASDSTFVDCPAIAVEKDGPATVYHGDKATFTFKVTNPGNVPLTAIAVGDDKCAPVTGPVARTGGNQDAALDPGEAWSYTCTRTIEPHQAGEANPVVNTVTATGTDRHGETHSAKDTHETRILHPAIDIEKSGPATATVGDVLDYTLVIKNPGDVPFPAQNVVVTDPKCTQPPVLRTKGADATPGTFDPGDAWTYSCSAETTGLQPGTFVNRATVTGTDGNGRVVSDLDDFPTELAAQAVIPNTVVKGTARLSGPSGCVKKAFNATVRGRRIAKVTFYVDGSKRATIKARTGQRTFKYKVRPNGLGRGVHRVTARVQFVAASETKSRTLRLSFQRCARQVVTPRFTG